MENQNVMENNEVMDVAEEISTSGLGTGLKFVGGTLAIVGLVYGGYKLVTKFKAKKKSEENPDTVCDEDKASFDVID